MKTLIITLALATALAAQAPNVSRKHAEAWIKAKQNLADAELRIVRDCIAGYRPQFDPATLTFACVRPTEPPVTTSTPEEKTTNPEPKP